MKSIVRNLSAALLLYIVLWGLIVAIPDAVTFHQVVTGAYTTPWYTTSWLKEPYTNARLLGKPHTESWTKNAVGDDWFVREVNYDGKHIFWTILQTGKGENI